MVDCDPQASLTESLGIHEPDSLKFTLSTVMENILNEQEFDALEGIIRHEEGVYLLPANIDLSGAEVALVGIMSSETILQEYLEMIRADYDFIVLDCPPNLGQLTLNALVSADYVIIPVQAAFLSAKGLEQLLRTIIKVKKRINHNLNIMGILITMVDWRTNNAKEIIDILKETYEEQIHFFKSIIPISVKAAEVSAAGISIYKYEKKSKVAKAYEQLVEEVLHYD